MNQLEVLQDIQRKIESEVEELGFTSSVNSDGDEIVLKMKTMPECSARIYINREKRACFSVKNCFSVDRVTGTYSDGTIKSTTKRYFFWNAIPYQEEEQFGFCKKEFNYSQIQYLTPLRKEFKPTKSKKLILNDLLPKLEQYSNLCIQAVPKVLDQIEQDEKVIALHKKLDRISEYPTDNLNRYNDLSNQSFTVVLNGKKQKITVLQGGSITVERSMSMEELEEVLK